MVQRRAGEERQAVEMGKVWILCIFGIGVDVLVVNCSLLLTVQV